MLTLLIAEIYLNREGNIYKLLAEDHASVRQKFRVWHPLGTICLARMKSGLYPTEVSLLDADRSEVTAEEQ